MTHFVTQKDVDDLLHFAALSAATRLKVPYAEWESTDKLLAAVSKKDSHLARALTDFIAAYTTWYRFHETLIAKGQGVSLDATQHNALLDVIAARDNKRQAFIFALKSGL
jgi:fructoselysine-6-P-deglycase FrlB-like protein